MTSQSRKLPRTSAGCCCGQLSQSPCSWCYLASCCSDQLGLIIVLPAMLAIWERRDGRRRRASRRSMTTSSYGPHANPLRFKGPRGARSRDESRAFLGADRVAGRVQSGLGRDRFPAPDSLLRRPPRGTPLNPPVPQPTTRRRAGHEERRGAGLQQYAERRRARADIWFTPGSRWGLASLHNSPTSCRAHWTPTSCAVSSRLILAAPRSVGHRLAVYFPAMGY